MTAGQDSRSITSCICLIAGQEHHFVANLSVLETVWVACMLQDKAFASQSAADQMTNMEALLDVVGLLGVKDVKARFPSLAFLEASRHRWM